MIKLLLSGKQILIASLVFILLANTTNLTFPNAISEKTTKDWVNPAEASEKENDFLSPENVDKSITFIGENEPGFIKTPEQKRAEELETIADMEDDLADADTSKEKKAIQAKIDKAKERFDIDKEKLTGYDEQGRQLNVINGDYDEEPNQIEDWQNQVNTDDTTVQKIKEIAEDAANNGDDSLERHNENKNNYVEDDDNNNAEEATEQEEEADESQDEDTEFIDDSSGGDEDDESEEEQDESEEEEQDEPEEESESEE